MKWRVILVAAAFVALITIAFFNRAELAEATRLLEHANYWVLATVPLIQLLSFYSNARYYQTFLATFNYHPKLSRLYKLSFALNFVNQITPSAGVTGATFFSYGLRRQVPAGKATLVQYGRYAMTYISYAAILMLALAFLYFGGGIDKIVVRIVIILVTATITIGIILLIFIFNRYRFNRLVYWVQRVFDWISGHFRRGKDPLIGKERATRLLNEFHNGLDLIIKERRRLKKPLFYALTGNLMELATLYVVFLALGFYVNPGAVIISYAIASSVGIISVVPGDVGVFELAMITALSATGIPIAVGLSATLLYRVLNKALFLPVGFYFYSQIINPKKHG